MLKTLTILIIVTQLSFAQMYPEYKDKGWGYWHLGISFVYPKTPLSEEIVVSTDEIIAARASSSLNILVKFSFINVSGVGVLNIIQFFPDKNENNHKDYDLYFRVGESAAVVISLIKENKINSILTVKFEEWNPETGKATLKISQEEL